MARKWYIVQTYSGQENSVKQDLERRIESMGFQDKILTILSPDDLMKSADEQMYVNKKILKESTGFNPIRKK